MFCRLFIVFFYFETISALLKLFGYILLCFPGPSETVRGSNFYESKFFLLCFTLCPFETKRGSNFYF
jgi:hypothetical protein